MSKITGNQDGKNGENATYDVNKRTDVPRRTVVKETKEGLHPTHHVEKINGKEYIRSNPDGTKNNNVNKGKK